MLPSPARLRNQQAREQTRGRREPATPSGARSRDDCCARSDGPESASRCACPDRSRMKRQATSFDRCPMRPITRCFTDQGYGPDFQHFEIVIGFEQQHVRAAQMEADRIRQIAQIGGDRNLDAFGAERESHRIGGIVRNGEAGDVDIADGESSRRPGKVRDWACTRPRESRARSAAKRTPGCRASARSPASRDT